MESKLPERKRTRLKYFDYSRNGAYFITICTQDRKNILSSVVKNNKNVGDGAHDIPKIKLTQYGEIVEKYIISTNEIDGVIVDSYVIMPNHIHIIIAIRNGGTSRAPSPTNAIIPHVVSTLKRLCNKEIGHNIFQRSFHDHIIRDGEDYDKISKYIYENPLNWESDCFYSEDL